MNLKRGLLTTAVALALSAISGTAADAGVIYATEGSLYTQNFDALPNSPENTNLQAASPAQIWKDDSNPDTTVTPQIISQPGWFLYHPIAQAAEGGTNQHQRFRIGAGSNNTGSFWSFGSSGSTERALGEVGSTTTAVNGAFLWIGLRLTNNTGKTLTDFTISFDGEQWRDGGAAVPTAEDMTFDYSLNATGVEDAAATFVNVPSLTWSSPVNANTGGGAAVDGNNAGKVAGKTATVSGINWANGSDLLLRWNNLQRAGNDHGMAIDNVSFSAVEVPEPASMTLLLGTGAMLLGRRRKI